MEARIPSPSPAPDRPDAVRWPHGPRAKAAANAAAIPNDLKEAAVELAELHLQCGPHELAQIRHQAGYYFATRDIYDTEFFPIGHALEKQPRYRWVDVGEGVEQGWLIDG